MEQWNLGRPRIAADHDVIHVKSLDTCDGTRVKFTGKQKVHCPAVLPSTIVHGYVLYPLLFGSVPDDPYANCQRGLVASFHSV